MKGWISLLVAISAILICKGEEKMSTTIQATGQAGYIIQSKSGLRLGIDLYLSECVEPLEGHVGFKRLLPHLFDAKNVDLDVIVATHEHYDHFDVDAMADMMANGKSRLFCSVDCDVLVKKCGIDESRVTYVKPGDTAEIGDFKLRFTTSDHGKGAPDAVGVVVTVDGKRVFEAGDTCLHTERAAEFLADGSLDILIAPINGAYGNLNEAECAELAAVLKPKMTIPCHYGMFASHGGNPGLFHDIMTKQHPELGYLLMQMGEIYEF